MTELILALDQGTTGSTAAFFDAHTLQLKATAKVEFPQVYPEPGLVEHDPAQIWASVLEAISRSGKKLEELSPSLSVKEVIAIGITNQRETIVPWDRVTGETLGNALVWQDRRTADFCAALKKDALLRKKILNTTGLVCDPYFSGSKARWLLHHRPSVQVAAKKGSLILGTIDSFLISKLTQGKSVVTEDTNASRTMWYNLQSGRYDPELLSLFGVNEDWLPHIQPSVSTFGYTRGVPGLPDGIPITGCLGDQQAALFGHDAREGGEGKITYGTGAFLLVNIGETIAVSDEGLLTTVAYSADGRRTFALEGSAFIAGAAIQFIRDNFGWIQSASEAEPFALKERRDPFVYFVPAFAGLGAPYWNPSAKAVLFGLSRGTKKEQIVRAVLESIALQNVQILSLMEKSLGRKLGRLGVDGGAANSDYLMQFQADMVRAPLQRLDTTEITALGAAKAALMGLGRPAIKSHTREKIFTPQMNEPDARSIVQEWSRAAECVNAFYAAT